MTATVQQTIHAGPTNITYTLIGGVTGTIALMTIFKAAANTSQCTIA